MGLSVGSRASSSSSFRPQKLPMDASTLALQNESCHCVADAELDNRYNMLRAEEHARKEGKCGPEWTTEVAELPDNAGRNRYASVVPWDHSRVILPVAEGENDYINASWVQLGSRTYIATQGPLASTVTDFWQMVYAYGGEPAVIIMLTPLYEHAVEKCVKYWPDNKGNPIVVPRERGFKFGLTVNHKSSHKNDHYHYSTLTLTPTDKSMPERTVHHIYYFSWLDYSKPNADADLRALIHLVNNELRNRASPPIVHCSAGIGRTGTFIALDALLTRIDTDILPVVMPRVNPVWKGSQKTIQYRKSLFTGAEDTDVGADSNSPLLSKFDVAQVSSVAPSTRSHSVGSIDMKGAQQSQDGFSTSATVSTTKRQVDNNPENSHSLLSAAIAQSRKENGTAATPSSGMATLAEIDEKSCAFSQITADTEPEKTENDDLSPKKKSSALSGPAIRKVAAKITSVPPEVFSETPDNVDVLDWFKTEDPVMSVTRTMRKQRPKMVQGRQQLGYIYDQFEVGLQLARAAPEVRRRSTQSSIEMTQDSSAGSSSSDGHHNKLKHIRVLSKVGIHRRSSTDHSPGNNTTSSSSSSVSSLKGRLFSGTVLR